MRTVWHRIQHWFGSEPLRKHTEWHGDERRVYVACATCGKLVLEFRSKR